METLGDYKPDLFPRITKLKNFVMRAVTMLPYESDLSLAKKRGAAEMLDQQLRAEASDY